MILKIKQIIKIIIFFIFIFIMKPSYNNYLYIQKYFFFKKCVFYRNSYYAYTFYIHHVKNNNKNDLLPTKT